jgi:hypothetical protein
LRAGAVIAKGAITSAKQVEAKWMPFRGQDKKSMVESLHQIELKMLDNK